jgi:hypothetical protein
MPLKVTNLHESDGSHGGCCVASVGDLLELKGLVDALLECEETQTKL